MNGFKTWLLFCLSLLICLKFLGGKGLADEKDSATAKRPNVIVILVDDSGYSDLGCYGSEIDTPNLDSLASNGLRFSQFYNTARCWPTRAALMTGYYAQMVGRDKLPELGGGGGNRGRRPEWAVLIPDYLKPYGYRNYHSGKWHIDGKCLDAGFDRSYRRNNQGNFFTEKGNQEDDKAVNPSEDETDFYATTSTADHAIKCLKEHANEYADRPFFSYVAFIAPHFPLHAPQSKIDKYRERYLEGWDAMRQERYTKQRSLGLHNAELSKREEQVGPPYHFPDALKKLGEGEINRPVAWNSLSAEQKKFQATKMAIHAAMVDCIDVEIGRIVSQLKKMKQFDNTLIFFASDNGASAEIMVRHGGHDPKAPMGSEATYLCLGPGFSTACNTPFRRHKTWVHEGGISTPLVVHWPKGIQAKNEIRHTPGHVVDILPTILDAAKIERPEKIKGSVPPVAPGKSLLPAFENDITVQRDMIWWMHENNLAVRVGDFKLVSAKIDRDPSQPDQPVWELYNVAKDRAEQNNLAESMPEKVAELKSAWEAEYEKICGVVKKSNSNRKRKK